MAIARIELERTDQSDNLLTALQNLRNARDRLDHAKAVMETCIDNGDYTELEALFGAPTGKGETVYNLIAGVVGDLAGFNASATIARMG